MCQHKIVFFLQVLPLFELIHSDQNTNAEQRIKASVGTEKLRLVQEDGFLCSNMLKYM